MSFFQNQKNLHRQKRALLALEFCSGFCPAGSVWVLLLGLRGLSPVSIGLAESVFHLVSLCGELPSGLLADLLGRRRTLLASRAMFVLSALLMAAANGFWGVCLSLAVSALGYNLASGTREAITYESLLAAGQQAGYLRFSGLQNALFRGSAAAAMLLAGGVVLLGPRRAYLLDALVSLAGLLAVLALREPPPELPGGDIRGDAVRLWGFWPALRRLAGAAIWVLREDKTARRVMAGNALAGAAATLTLFFLQRKIGAALSAGTPELGPALVLLGLGGALAGLGARPLSRLPWGKAAALAGCGIGFGVLLARHGSLPLLLAAGLLAGFCDDSLQLVSDSLLNARFPTAQRATLISVASLLFSLAMIPLSPAFGWLLG